MREEWIKGERITGYYLLMFGLGLVLLVWGSDLFVDSAVLIANHFHLSEVLVGATIVSIGTTLPETLFSTMASVQGLPDMALGNALGSILCNTGFIAALMMVIRPVELKKQEVRNLESGVFFLGAGFLVYFFSGLFFGGLTRFSGMVLLLLCAFFLFSTGQNARRQEQSFHEEEPQKLAFGEIVRLPLEAGAIYIGADILVKYGPKLAAAMGVPELMISLTFVALGTSLPELVTSLTALRKKHASLSLGNIIGADILNFVLVGGISSVICPVAYPAGILSRELLFIFYLLFVLCVPSIQTRRAGRAQGLLMLGGYGLYLALMVAH